MRVARLLCAVLAGTAALAVLTACTGGDEPSSPPRLHDIARFLVPHGDDVRRHDRAAFMSGVSDMKAARRFRTDQQAAFDNLVRIPLTTWRYTVDELADDQDAQAAARRTYGASAVIAHVTLSYALRGADPVPTQRDLWWTFVRQGASLAVAADDGLAELGSVSWTGPWDHGPVQVVRGQSCVVIGHPIDGAALTALTAAVDAAVPAVTSVWGTDWTRYVAVFVPSTPDERSALLGASGSSNAPTAALARTDGQDAATGRPYGQRLVADPSVLRTLSPLGLRIVVTHEVTHIASAAATTEVTPTWLIEGFADYVANLRTGQPVATVAAELRADVRRGRVPDRLPTQTDFATTPAQAYEGAWLACRLVAARVGTAGLVRFYRAVAASTAVGDDAVTDALRTQLHTSPAGFVAVWRAYLVAQLR